MNEIQFGKYTLLDKLGDGGMAEVFLAQMKGPEGFSKFVAIKRILPHLSHDAVFTESFINEARLGGYLSHHNIVQTLDFGQIDDFYYLTMEYVQGINLGQVLRHHQKSSTPLPLSLGAEIALQISEGLAYAHEAADTDGRPLKMVHRDLKPSNILINTHGVVKIADFGVARAETNISQTVAGTGNPKGTVAYMSPEQALGMEHLDHRADVFSLGAILYEMAMNERLYTSETYLGALRQAQDARIEERLAKLESLPNGPLLLPALRKALAPEPADRYRDAAAFRQDLRRIVMKLEPDLTLADYVRGRMTESGSPLVTRGPARNTGKPSGAHVSMSVERPAAPATPVVSRPPPQMPPPAPPQRQGPAPMAAPPQAAGPPRPSGPWQPPQAAAGGMMASVEVASAQPPASPVWYPPPPGQPLVTGHPPQTLPGPAPSVLDSQTLSRDDKAGARPSRVRALGGAVGMVVLLIGIGMVLAWVLASGPRHVRVDLTPDDAELKLANGQPVRSGVPIEVPGDGMTLRAEKVGFTSKTVNIPGNVEDGKVIQLKLDPNPASAQVTLDPPDATLLIDGAPREGSSPFSLKDLPVDRTLKLKAQREGYTDEEVEVALAPGESRRLTLKLQPIARQAPPEEPRQPSRAGKEPASTRQPAPAPVEAAQPDRPQGFLICNAVPRGGGAMWAKVHVDGAYVGNTPLLKHPLPAGSHEIKLIAQDGRSSTHSVNIREGETTRLIAEFD